MTRVYLSGNLSSGADLDWRRKAQRRLAEIGCEAINPARDLLDENELDTLPVSEQLDRNRRDLLSCDLLLAHFPTSVPGAMAGSEWELARRQDIPRIIVEQAFSDGLAEAYYGSELCPTLDAAIVAIENGWLLP